MKIRNSILAFLLIPVIVCGIYNVHRPVQNVEVTLEVNPIVNLADKVSEVMPSVVHISKLGVCQGSGFIVSKTGLIVTAKHVTDGGGDFEITLDDGRVFLTSTCLEYDGFDVAFLKIDANDLPAVQMGDYTQLRPGDQVFICGSPFGFGNFNSVTTGIISAMQRDLDAEMDYGYGWRVLFQTDAAANPGNSGGPVFNMEGKVVGILVAGMTECVNYCVPTAIFEGRLELIENFFQLKSMGILHYAERT